MRQDQEELRGLHRQLCFCLFDLMVYIHGNGDTRFCASLCFYVSMMIIHMEKSRQGKYEKIDLVVPKGEGGQGIV